MSLFQCELNWATSITADRVHIGEPLCTFEHNDACDGSSQPCLYTGAPDSYWHGLIRVRCFQSDKKVSKARRCRWDSPSTSSTIYWSLIFNSLELPRPQNFFFQGIQGDAIWVIWISYESQLVASCCIRTEPDQNVCPCSVLVSKASRPRCQDIGATPVLGLQPGDLGILWEHDLIWSPP